MKKAASEVNCLECAVKPLCGASAAMGAVMPSSCRSFIKLEVANGDGSVCGVAGDNFFGGVADA